ncbi:MAG: NAD(P)-dependent oxidoreductase [Phycisphaerae bacterium]|nr:NAD(P)-dependent oxidoreductase [Phycisphaerae bacterium]
MSDQPLKIAVTGATGYVGGRLTPKLLKKGLQVRCLVRSSQKLKARKWASKAEHLEVLESDLSDINQLTESLKGCRIAFYLVHSMTAAGRDYDNVDQTLAQNFSKAAKDAGVERIIYLGGLGELGQGLSEHLSSRIKVEEALASSGISLTVLRAAMIIGSGSTSFEILRYLVERLPIMITPRWVKTRCQPISIVDVLEYMVACIDEPSTADKRIDIGGSEVVTYRELMKMVATELGLKTRFVIPVPVLSPKLSSYWIHMVTPVNSRIAIPLAEGLSNTVVCRNDLAQKLLPRPCLSPQEAIRSALQHEKNNEVETSWLDAGPVPGDPDWSGGHVYVDTRETTVAANQHSLYQAIKIIGGGHGYYAADWLWRIRGLMDKCLGGPGLRRGRRDNREIGCGDALDFWRVLIAEPGRKLLLYAEMKLPGTATLEFEITPDPADSSKSILKQTARFRPRGLLGLLYWHSVKPLHGIVFTGMLEGIRREAEKNQDEKLLSAQKGTTCAP